MANEKYDIISRSEARGRGLKHYFTGIPCPHGHCSPRYVKHRECVLCAKEGVVRRRAADPERARQQNRKSWWKHIDRRRKHDRERYLIPERLEIKRLKSKIHAKKYRKDNPEKVRAITHNARAKKRANGGSHTGSDIIDIMRLQNNRCALCRIKIGVKIKYEVDHIVPVSAGGSNDRRNLQCLCKKCNNAKAAKDQIDYVRTLGKLL